MSNPTVPTAIVDKNGKPTTVHRNAVPKTGAGSRVKSVPAPTVTLKSSREYVAPRDPALQKRVKFDGVLMTWGDALEDIQPVGLRRTVFDNTPTWSAIHPDNFNISTSIPTAVAKASGLEDMTDPITRVSDDHALALFKLDKLTASVPPFERGSEATNKWAADVSAQEQVVKDTEKIMDDAKRAKERDAFDAMDESTRSNHVYDNKANKYKVEALLEFALDNGDTELVKRIANSHNRSFLGEEHRTLLLKHPDESVRGAFLEGNSSLSPYQLFRATENDQSPFVRSVAQSTLDQRGIKAWRDERDVVHTDPLS